MVPGPAEHASPDDLVGRAMGESAPDVDAHAAGCAACADELRALSATVRAGRGAGPGGLPPAPDSIWLRICDELGVVASPVTATARVALPPGRPAGRARRRAVLAVAAGVTALAAGVGVAAGTLTTSAPRAPLAAFPDVAPGASGEVSLEQSSAGRQLTVRASDLPPVDGYYEVWLLDPDTGRMVALGALDAGGSASLPVPDAVDPLTYPTVDVSVEQDDGDPAHSGVSALRGPVPS
jgi:hypothetical protein